MAENSLTVKEHRRRLEKIREQLTKAAMSTS
jgi:hypothetical protein